MSIAARIIALQIAHELGDHKVPAWQCPECASVLHAEAIVARSEQGVLGHCHTPGDDHAWYHKHGSVWMYPAEARPFA